MTNVSTGYALAYRLGLRPWEHYATVAAASIAAMLDREEAARSRPLGRALDLGCGRGQKTHELARRGWEAVGVDKIPLAIDAARRRCDSPGARFLVGDVTNLPAGALGKFDFFLDIGCFQGLNTEQQLSMARCISSLAAPGATLLLLEFGATRLRPLVGGVTETELATAFSGWTMLTIETAETAGLRWPLTKTAPQWYRLRRDDDQPMALPASAASQRPTPRRSPCRSTTDIPS